MADKPMTSQGWRFLCALLFLSVLGVLSGTCSCQRERSCGCEKVQQRVRTALAEMKGLPDEARAQAVWDLWMELAEDRTIADGTYDYLLAEELATTGDPGMRILLEALKGDGKRAKAAQEWLHLFGDPALPPLLEMLQSDSPDTQWAALWALWGFCVCEDLESADVDAIREAVTPLLEHESPGIRQDARIVLDDLNKLHGD